MFGLFKRRPQRTELQQRMRAATEAARRAHQEAVEITAQAWAEDIVAETEKLASKNPRGATCGSFPLVSMPAPRGYTPSGTVPRVAELLPMSHVRCRVRRQNGYEVPDYDSGEKASHLVWSIN